jgi:CSLREA domain-containing protein
MHKSTLTFLPLLSRARLAMVLVVLALAGLPLQVAHAATWVVTILADSDDAVCDVHCSLREALYVANDGDVIRFETNLAGSTIVLSGELVINRNVTISGLGVNQISISGNDASRVIYITSDAIVTINDLTIRNGYRLVNAGQDGGGGILNDGMLTLRRVHVTDNRVVDNGDDAAGGGILNYGILEIDQSAITNNRVEDSGFGGCFGAGIANYGDLTILNSTISANQGVDNRFWCYGGGIDHSGDVLTIEFSTITTNSLVRNNGDVVGGGLSASGSDMTIRNSIIAGNTPSNCGIESSVNYTSGGFNLESGTNCLFNQIGDAQNSDPLLGPLQNNGGPTPNHALLTGSPAIDRIAIDTGGCLPGSSIDQRGLLRAAGPDRGGSACDSGAFEANTTRLPSAVRVTEVSARSGGIAWHWLALAGLSGLLAGYAYQRWWSGRQTPRAPDALDQ